MLARQIELRSYKAECHSHAHDFAQLVLPVTGAMELETRGFSGVVNQDIGLYIAPNEMRG